MPPFAVRYGLDQPLPVQFVNYLRDLLPGDLGMSIKYRLPVTDLIVQRLPTTIELSFFALTVRHRGGRPAGHHLGVPPELRRRRGHDG